ncbi:hypothetical protein PFISCL1PPCAC_3612, partial [Pristionchus fissidentatus]
SLPARMRILRLCSLIALFIWTSASEETPAEIYDDEAEAIEVVSVKNDKATIAWKLPDQIGNKTTRQRLMITIRPGQTSAGASTYSVNVKPATRSYTFENLEGNTTYRASIEAFENDRSVWYSSNTLHTSLAALDWLAAPKDLTLIHKTNSTIELSWSIPLIVQGTTSAL